MRAVPTQPTCGGDLNASTRRPTPSPPTSSPTQEIALIGQATSQVALASRNTAGASDAVLKAAGELTKLAQALNARGDPVIGELRVA